MNPFVLSKDQSQILKGIAILMMLWHHIFGCYNIPPEIVKGLAWKSGWVDALALQGKTCVYIFIFVSGYGFAQKFSPSDTLAASWLKGWRSWVKFYKVYLICLLLAAFIFYLFPVFPINGRMPGIWDIIPVKPFFPDWWYASLFMIICLAAYPLSDYIRAKTGDLNVIALCSIIAVCMSSVLILSDLLPTLKNLSMILYACRYLPLFFLAYSIGIIGKTPLENSRQYWAFITVSYLLCAGIRLWHDPSTYYWFILFAVILIAPTIKYPPLCKALICFGHYSMWMWLTHRFIFGYYFSSTLYQLNPWLIYGITIPLSLGLAILLNRIFRRLI